MDTACLQVLKYRYELKIKYPDIDENSLDLLVSASTEFNPGFESLYFQQWLAKLNETTLFENTIIPFSEMKNWYFDDGQNIRHESGKFFSIEGINVRVISDHETKEWKQPIINQPEVGILGIICQKRYGILYFLLQAKIEPGNVNKIQMSPTVQATRSNFTQVHGGKKPPYLEYFINIDQNKIIVDQLQSEQGARFLKKRNRNMIIEIDENDSIELLDHYCWLTLGQIKRLLRQDNIINMDTRTVLSCTQLHFVRK